MKQPTANGAHQRCAWRTEPIEDMEDRAPVIGAAMHFICGMRAMLGSVAHIEGYCGCYVPGAGETDPPGMSKREAAKAAVAAWMRKKETGER